MGFCPAPCCGDDVYTDCNNYFKFKKEGETISVAPLCCGCGTGYVKVNAGAPATVEMER